MANGELRTVIGQLRRLIGGQRGSTLTDTQLLEDFVTRHDEKAFEVLVWRHGTMVLSLCQRILRDSHAAEDAFQATFLLFARKAGAIGKGDAVGSWLFKVAYRVALRALAKGPKGTGDLRLLEELPAPPVADDVLWRDLRPVLDEEIARLPEKYRVPFVLCCLEGQTNKEAALQLGCPEGTVLSRLSRGRERLRSRLTRRGLTLSLAGLTAALAQNVSTAAVPAALVSSTIGAAIPFAAGQAAAGLVSAWVAALTEGVLHAMFLTKVKIATAAVLALVLLGTSAGSIAHWALAESSGRAEALAERSAEEAAAQGREGRDAPKEPLVVGKVLAVAQDGKSFTLEIPPAGRGADAKEAQKIEVKIDAKTAITFHGVGPDGAKLTVGHNAQVRSRDGAKDVAASVAFVGPDGFGRRRPDLTGKVIAVPGSGSIALEVPSPRAREEDAKKVTVKFNDKTQLVFSHIAKGGAIPKEDYEAQVWLEDPQGDTATSIHFQGKEMAEERGGPVPDVAGKVLAVAKDATSITVESRAAEAGGRGAPAREAEKIEIKIGAKTAVAFNNVGPDGTSIVPGSVVRVWLEEGSKNSAGKMSIFGVVREHTLGGKIAGVSPDGKTITVEDARSAGRGEEPRKVVLKLTPKTRLSYFGVGLGEAKLTEGYFIQARLEMGTTDVAVEISLGKQGTGRR